MTPQEIAKSIADELREHPERWIQGATSDGTGGRCLVEHIYHRAPGADRIHSIYPAFQTAAGCDLLWPWNDAPERTVADVIALCDKVSQS